MKKLLFLSLLCIFSVAIFAQDDAQLSQKKQGKKKEVVVEDRFQKFL